jgi:hypothetical protein
VIERLSEPEAFLAVSDPLLDLSLVSEHPSQVAAGHHGRKSGLAEPFPTQVAFEPLEDSQEKPLGLSIVTREEAGHAEVERPRHPERTIAKRLGDGLGALAEPERVRRMPGDPKVVTQVDGELPESPLIVERPGQAFGFTEAGEDPPEFSQRKQCRSQVEPQIDGLLQRLAGLGQMPERRQRLFEAAHRLAVGGPRQSFDAGLAEVCDRLLP